VWIQTNLIFEGIPGAFLRGRGPVWAGRGSSTALSPGPSSKHPAACVGVVRRTVVLPMTEGACRSMSGAPERSGLTSAALCVCPDGAAGGVDPWWAARTQGARGPRFFKDPFKKTTFANRGTFSQEASRQGHA
jgi:hypothetical protein